MSNIIQRAPHLLIVDDDPIVVMLHKRVSKKAGLHQEPQIFTNGEEALRYIQQYNSPADHHVVLLDINMPVMDGWELLEKLAGTELQATVNVVMVTSSLDASDEKRANEYEHVIGYITKPIRKENLEALKADPRLEQYIDALGSYK